MGGGKEREMNEACKVILSMSFSGSIMIMILIATLSLLRNKLSRQWQYYIWLIAVIRLLLPFAPQNNLANMVFQRAGAAVNSVKTLHSEEIPDAQGESGKAAPEQWEITETQNTDAVLQQTNFFGAVRQYLWLIWILPACILLAAKLASYKKLLKQIRAGNEDVQDIVLLERLGRLLEKQHIRSTISLFVNSTVPSPMMTGVFKPCIILPSTEMTASEFECIVLHELTHYRRKDILYKWLVQFTICIHWFNPCSYILERMVNKACELSCDEAVMQKLDAHERYIYGDTLLYTVGRNIKYRTSVSTTTFSNGKKDLKERLNAIMNFKKRTKTSFIAAFALSAGLLASSAYLGVYASGEQNALAKSTARVAADAVKVQNKGEDSLKKTGGNSGKDNTITAKTVKKMTDSLSVDGTYAFTAKAQNAKAKNGKRTVKIKNGTYTFTAKAKNGKHKVTVKKRKKKNGTYAYVVSVK